MNAREKIKYEFHIADIKKYSIKAKFWLMLNAFWQMVFFGTLFIGAMVAFVGIMGRIGMIGTGTAGRTVKFIEIYFYLAFGILMPFSFPLMMWSGMVKGKWDGKLTRASAYALSFLENIEHREYLEIKEQRKTRVKPKQKTIIYGKTKSRSKSRSKTKEAYRCTYCNQILKYVPESRKWYCSQCNLHY